MDKKDGAMPAYLMDRENINRSKVMQLIIGSEQHCQAKKEGKSRKMGSACLKGEANERGRDVQGRQVRQTIKSEF